MQARSTLLALSAPSNAPSCPPESPTSPGIARRAILARTAAALGLGAAANVMAVVATRSAPTVDDPIFAALDAHRAVWTKAQAAIRENDRYETEIRRANRQVSLDEQWQVFQDLVGSAWDAHHDASVDLVNTLPTTIAGVVALLDYVVEFEIAQEDCLPDAIPGWSEDGDRDDEQPFHIWLLNSVSLALSGIAERGEAA